MNKYKWIAHRGTKYQQTVGMGFDTKREAVDFARAQNRSHNSGYIVDRSVNVAAPKFN